jgi:hypothetical protein
LSFIYSLPAFALLPLRTNVLDTISVFLFPTGPPHSPYTIK